jgi:deazaflavin-dependent oxidoreductase (nitroreductase family)
MTTEGFDASAFEEQLIADMRAHGGRPSGGPMAGQPLLLMFSTGAKTGERRRSILTYSQDGDALVVAGTASGSKVDPAWVANVTKNPTVELEAGNETYRATAMVHRDGPERDRLWNQHVEQLPWFGDYPAQVGDRVIPVVRLTRSG